MKDVIRVPECYGIFKDENDEECKEFCLVLEDFDQENWMPFDQFDNPVPLTSQLQIFIPEDGDDLNQISLTGDGRTTAGIKCA